MTTKEILKLISDDQISFKRKVDISDMTTKEILKLINDDQISFKRMLRVLAKDNSAIRGRLGEAEAYVERRNNGNDKKKHEVGFRNDGKGSAEVFLERQREGAIQEQQLENFARQNKIWFNELSQDGTLESYLSTEFVKTFLGGSEAQIFYDRNDNDIIIKSINLSHTDDNPRMMLDRLVIFNELFPKTAYELIGFGRDELGHFHVIVKQKKITDAVPATQKEIDEYTKSIELSNAKNSSRYDWLYNGDRSMRITDLSPNNVLKTKNGNLAVIDADIELADKTPGLVWIEKQEPEQASSRPQSTTQEKENYISQEEV